MNIIQDDQNEQQTNVDRALPGLKALLVSISALTQVGIKATTGIDVPLGNFDLKKIWKYHVEAFRINLSGKPWYTLPWQKSPTIPYICN